MRLPLLGLALLAAPAVLGAQQPTPPVPATPAPGTPAAGRAAGPVSRRPPDYPDRPPAAPEVLAHGQQLFGSNCSFCHGSDARGGETGPNLVRSQVVLDDRDGELIIPIVQNGRPAQGMPKFALSASDIGSIAAWLHSQPKSDRGTPSALDVMVGNAQAGQSYFAGAGQCTRCHSTSGDLAGIGGKFDPKTIQNLLVSGGRTAGMGRRPADAAPLPRPPRPTVVVSLPSGQTVAGTLDHISAFVVALRDSSGMYRSFTRHGGTPRVVVTDPLQWHVDMLTRWRDADIHNLTAYLSTLK